MASKNDGSRRPCLHHHCGGYHHQQHRHYFYVSPHCPLHRPILLPHNHSPSCSFSTSSNPNPLLPDPQLIHLHAQTSNDARVGEEDKMEDEDEEDPIFVLTDEWRDLFAKSEAKRRLAKKQAKKRNK